jgi:phenylacetate-CoA ligase
MTEDGRRLLRRLREHPAAPRYTHQIGDRLTPEGFRRVREFQADLETETATRGWSPTAPPDWSASYLAFAYREVPIYRRRGAPPALLADVPTTNRQDLEAEPWAFVPDSQPLDELTVYTTSGTHGRPLSVLSGVEVSAMYLPLLRWALARRGVTLEGGPGKVAIAQVCAQHFTFTFPTIATYLDQAAMVKINLNPAEWRGPEDRARFLDDCRPEIIAGDPIAFAELMRLPMSWRPKALVSASMAMPPTLRERLEARFGPVLDIYSITEAGPIAVEERGEWMLFPRRLYVEAVGGDDRACGDGELGEVALTGGFNTFLCLVRYRTGDHGSLTFRGSQPVLRDLELRPPTVYRRADGRLLNNIDVTMALQRFGLDRFRVFQSAAGDVHLKVAGIEIDEGEIRKAMLDTFGGIRVAIERMTAEEGGGRVPEHRSEISFQALLEQGLW